MRNLPPVNQGIYRDRSILFGEMVRQFDETSDVETMEYCAKVFRQRYTTGNPTEKERIRAVIQAAWCQSLADRKRYLL